MMRALAAEMDDLRESAAAASSWAWLPDVVELRTHLEGCSWESNDDVLSARRDRLDGVEGPPPPAPELPTPGSDVFRSYMVGGAAPEGGGGARPRDEGSKCRDILPSQTCLLRLLHKSSNLILFLLFIPWIRSCEGCTSVRVSAFTAATATRSGSGGGSRSLGDTLSLEHVAQAELRGTRRAGACTRATRCCGNRAVCLGRVSAATMVVEALVRKH